LLHIVNNAGIVCERVQHQTYQQLIEIEVGLAVFGSSKEQLKDYQKASHEYGLVFHTVCSG
jgi:hypothetical protein